MRLTIHIAVRRQPEGRQTAFGLVIADTDAARPIHLAGYHLGPVASETLAAYTALGQTLDLVLPLQPEEVRFVCDQNTMVEQITSFQGPAEPDAQQLFEQIMPQLLKLDSWQIAKPKPGTMPEAVRLAGRALAEEHSVFELSLTEASERFPQIRTGVPQWTVELLEEPGPDCPARCHQNIKYPFGPDTPAGFCVYAAQAVLTDGPLHWQDPAQRRMTTLCPHCEVPIQIEQID